MRGKGFGLLVKFGLVAVIAGVCVYALRARGLNEGIDIRGGHTVMYEVLQEPGARDVEVVAKAIAVLRRRVDPQGLASLEWRPLGGNRFEVRMPAGSVEAQQQKIVYDLALEQLDRGNVQRSEIRRLEQAPAAARSELIQQLAGEDEALAEKLRQLADAYDLREQRRRQYEAIKARGEQAGALQEAEDAKYEAGRQYEQKLKAVEDSNISRSELEAILANFVPPAEADALRKVGKPQEIERRGQIYADKLKELYDKHPAQRAQIEKLAALYETWASNRRPLGDPEDLKRLIAKAGVLEFRIAPRRPGATSGALEAQEYRKYVDERGRLVEEPDSLRRRDHRLQWFPIRGTPKDFSSETIIGEWGGLYYILLYHDRQKTMLHRAGGWKLRSARPAVDQYGRRAVGFAMDPMGARLLFKLTQGHVGQMMAILLDDEVYSAPVIQEAISEKGQITGSFTEAEQGELVRTLNAGSLPARVKFLSQNTFGPAIGRRNRDMGIRAAYLGLCGVAGFMLVYYLLVGVIANLALAVNILLVLGVMSLLEAVFTLPGIAGVILTIGIAVDANVLIFEELRRQLRRPERESVRLAVADAYKAAWPVIRDANITTLITCLILGWVGTEELRGFAITLGLGVVFSMFCAMLLTRWILELLAGWWGTRRSGLLPPYHVPEPKRFDWISKRYFFWAISLALIVMGIGSMVWQGGDIWGIEFSAGTKATIRFKDDALVQNPRTGAWQLPDDGVVRELFGARARAGGHEKLWASARVEEQIDPDKVEQFLRSYDGNGDGKVTLAEWQEAKKDPRFFRLVDARGDGDGVLMPKEISDYLPARAYQISTTETDAELIRDAAADAFGAALDRRRKCTFTLVADGPLEELGEGLLAGTDGITKISADPSKETVRSIRPDAARPEYQDALLDREGGLLLVIRDVDPAIAVAELKQRIRDTQAQPDFAGVLAETEVLGLHSAGEGGFSSFAIAVAAPAQAEQREDAETAWLAFAAGQTELLTTALQREEAMVASNFDAAIAGQTRQRAAIAIALSWLGIVLYLAVVFRGVQWGLAAVICLIHDVIIVGGLVAASGWLHKTGFGRALGIDSFKIDLAMIAAMLTVIGYSVNDTIVVFGKIRDRVGKGWSRRRFVHWTAVRNVLNEAINQTLSRTVITSVTTFIVVFVMYAWGGPGIHAFNYALLAGVVFGTYSSVAVAAPLLMGFRGAIAARIRKKPESGRGAKA